MSKPSYQPIQQQQQTQPPPPVESGPSLKELMQKLTMNTINFQQRTKVTIQTRENQIGQIAVNISQFQSQGSNKLPAQTVINPQNSTIKMRSNKNVYTTKKKHFEQEQESDALAYNATKRSDIAIHSLVGQSNLLKSPSSLKAESRNQPYTDNVNFYDNLQSNFVTK